jgi:hypothetical protein
MVKAGALVPSGPGRQSPEQARATPGSPVLGGVVLSRRQRVGGPWSTCAANDPRRRKLPCRPLPDGFRRTKNS